MAYPDCALALAFEGVSLRRRRGDEWVAQTQALFDAPDSRAALDRLRQKAAGPDGKTPVPVLLVLPKDQVLYGQLSGSEAGRDGARAVRTALGTRTPYAADALRFAFERLPDGGIAFAACALDTLDEAEDFARQNGFEPRGVLAPPKQGSFEAPVWFGTARQAAPDGWLPRPEGVAWAVAVEEFATPAQPNAARLAFARAKAKTAARRTPPVRVTAPAEGFTADEQARIDKLMRKTTRLGRLKSTGVRALWMGGAFAALFGGIVLWSSGSRPPSPELTAASQHTGPQVDAPAQTAVIAQLPEEQTDPAPPADPLAGIPIEIDETDLWTPERGLMRPADIAGLDRLVQPSLDPPVGADALALNLPEPDTGTPDLATLIRPPAPQIRFDIDAAGLVKPEPDGAETPEGFLVFEGRPPLLPSTRPDEIEAARAAAEQLAEATPPDAQDASDADVTPRQRPEDLIARFERSALGGRTRGELASLRPVPRRAELAAAAAAARAVETAAVDAALASAQSAATARPGAGDPRPKQRPAALARAASAQQRAVAAVAASSTAAVARAPAPSASRSEIEQAYVEPARSSTKMVVKQATSNRINLKDVNLLGTFGPTSAQRALVRLPSGRVVNLEVGDRFDGGRVSAIGKGELRYTKSGRPYVLKMPRG